MYGKGTYQQPNHKSEFLQRSLSLCFPHIDLHLAVEAVVEQQVVRHADAVRLHGVALPVVVVANVP